MKRYIPYIESIKQLDGIKLFSVGFNENPRGEWVKYEDVKYLYQSLLTILHLKAADEYDNEVWTKAWADAVNAIRKANGEGE